MHATINTRALSAINLAAATSEARFYLNGVYVEIEPNAVTYVATDGHIVAAYRDEGTMDGKANTLRGTFIIPRDVCKSLKPKFKADPLRELRLVGGEGATAEYRIESNLFRMVDGCFPAWRRVVPAKTSGEPAQFNLELLARAQAIGAALLEIKKVEDNLSGAPRVYHNGTSPALLGWKACPNLLCAVMPLYEGKWAQGEELPFWFLAQPHGQSVSEAAA